LRFKVKDSKLEEKKKGKETENGAQLLLMKDKG